MKGVKGVILKKMKKTIPHVGMKKRSRVLHLKASDALSGSPPPLLPPPPSCDSHRALRDLPAHRRSELYLSSFRRQDPDSANLFDPDRLSEFEQAVMDHIRSYEESSREIQKWELCFSSFRRQDPNSATLFAHPGLLAVFDQAVMDHIQSYEESSPEKQKSEPGTPPDSNSASPFDPDLLAVVEQAVVDHIRSYEESGALNEEDPDQDEEPPSKIPRLDTPLIEFEEKCPPGGGESVLLYTTSLGGIQKTFDDCIAVRSLLASSKVLFRERDVSMHREFREELSTALGGPAIPPRLFIRGRYIGGAADVLALHEKGRLLPLLEGMPLDRSDGSPCRGCGGMSFVLCFDCSGARKLYDEEQEARVECRHCNENGLLLCPICC